VSGCFDPLSSNTRKHYHPRPERIWLDIRNGSPNSRGAQPAIPRVSCVELVESSGRRVHCVASRGESRPPESPTGATALTRHSEDRGSRCRKENLIGASRWNQCFNSCPCRQLQQRDHDKCKRKPAFVQYGRFTENQIEKEAQDHRRTRRRRSV